MSKLQDPVLVVDDEADIRDLMEMTLMKMGLRVETAEGVEQAKDKLDNNDYSLVLTDMRMPDGSGLEVVQYIDELMLDTPVAVITAYGNADQAVEALKAGAFDYLQKPITLSQLRSLVKSAVTVADNAEVPPAPQPVKPTPAPVTAALNKPSAAMVARQTQPAAAKPASRDLNKPISVPDSLRSMKERFSSGETTPSQEAPQLGGEADMPRLLGTSPQMVEVRHLIHRLARSEVPVYIAGESGTGKEQAARTIHELSDRADKPFIAVNCGAIPENLMESEFFGYKKGSFTGAEQDRLGFFQHADGGTLFLDEVADLPLAMQVKLLRAIQEKAVRRIGDARESFVDVRIVCATHKNLEALVESGAFRQDLYYRLNVVSLHMPPLREMREDLGALILYLLYKHRHGNQTYKLSAKAQEALLHYSYPGNFRELENILERAVTLTVGTVIQLDDLQIHNTPADDEPRGHHSLSLQDISDSVSEAPLNHEPLPPFDPRTMQIQDYLDQIERDIIQKALEQTRYNRTQAAKLLGISFRSMRYRMERLDIN
ncbi:sigma-54-dependent Fis family transcriptional regulator [Neisseria sp. N95_16]|uniref:Response regulator n=1 Tax=Neisseria brasiliensis TaxID=2666100 RepID=A0A7X2GZ17_9NEIS|nr:MULTISPECIES: sigma-54 dependent transcriptional regulator [Neisseria]MRN38347.1 response regulator [Neisseria brasiliensis]PJO10245.1 sigma-54-dependent Fis family transcriptional regulator [Neisseria sp. N95_16]